MSKEHDLFLECYEETKRRYPGSNARTLKDLATRLHISVSDDPVCRMHASELHTRYVELSTALSSMDNWPGLKPGERPANAEEA